MIAIDTSPILIIKLVILSSTVGIGSKREGETLGRTGRLI